MTVFHVEVGAATAETLVAAADQSWHRFCTEAGADPEDARAADLRSLFRSGFYLGAAWAEAAIRETSAIAIERMALLEHTEGRA